MGDNILRMEVNDERLYYTRIREGMVVFLEQYYARISRLDHETAVSYVQEFPIHQQPVMIRQARERWTCVVLFVA